MSMHNTPSGYLRSGAVNPREAPSANLLSEKFNRSPHYFQVTFRITDDSWFDWQCFDLTASTKAGSLAVWIFFLSRLPALDASSTLFLYISDFLGWCCWCSSLRVSLESQTQRKKGLSDPTPPGTKSLGAPFCGWEGFVCILCGFTLDWCWFCVESPSCMQCNRSKIGISGICTHTS